MTRLGTRLALFATLPMLFAAMHAAPAAANSMDNTILSAREIFTSIWDSISEPFTGSTVEAVTPPSPMVILHDMQSKNGSHFWAHLSDAGYELTEIDTSVGLIPDVTLNFQLVRELSEADRESLDRQLDLDAKRDRRLVAAIQRQIVRTLLEVSDVSDMRVGKLAIGILPLPSASFTIEPAEAPMSEEHDALLRAIINKSTKRMSPDMKSMMPETPAGNAKAPASGGSSE